MGGVRAKRDLAPVSGEGDAVSVLNGLAMLALIALYGMICWARDRNLERRIERLEKKP